MQWLPGWGTTGFWWHWSITDSCRRDSMQPGQAPMVMFIKIVGDLTQKNEHANVLSRYVFLWCLGILVFVLHFFRFACYSKIGFLSLLKKSVRDRFLQLCLSCGVYHSLNIVRSCLHYIHLFRFLHCTLRRRLNLDNKNYICRASAE